MELMDDSLTHFLESSTQPIPYHIQVNVCHDITLALSFLHSNNIVHRDLSGNNVLLIGDIRAKVTDFGMARLGDINPQATRRTFTMCPGTDVYMPPEAVRAQPVYTEKVDCFSFGVVVVQILSRQFPKPGDRLKTVRTNDPQFPGGIIEVRASEVERRHNHISQIDNDQSLMLIANDCLKDRDTMRPSAQQLLERVAVLKESPEYVESARPIAREQIRALNSDVVQIQLRQKDEEIRQRNADNSRLQIESRQLQVSVHTL
jgi:serine/threonine protein kinase